MIKDLNYFLSLDLNCIPEHVKNAPTIRAEDDLWHDLLKGICCRLDDAPVPTDVLVAAVGKPDSVISLNKNDEVWSYKWFHFHGPKQYSSATPFHVRNGKVFGVIDPDGNASPAEYGPT